MRGSEARCAEASQRGRLERLMEAYQRSDEEAFSQLVKLLSPRLRSFFLGLYVTRLHSDDLLQDCWLRVHRARHAYKPGRPLLPWIFAIARHTRTDAYRKIVRSDIHPAGDADLMPNPKCLVRSAEAKSDFQTLMASLPARQREVVLLLKVRGLTLDEAARATGSTIGATKQMAHRAYTNLRSRAQVLNRPMRYGAPAN